MNDDLISRSALKKAFEEVYPLATNEIGGVVNKRIYEIIDNAPTVEPPKWQYEFAKKLFEKVRPQGKWIKEEDKVHSKCSLCGFKYADYGILFNFCPNCGADMRGEENE